MKSEWQTIVRVGLVSGLSLTIALSPVFLLKSLQSSPFILIGFAALFPLTGFLAGRLATSHPVWASIVSAFVASLGILLLGIATGQNSSGGASTIGGFERIFLVLSMVKVALELWIQQTFVLTGLSAAGGAFALFIIRRKEKSANQTV